MRASIRHAIYGMLSADEAEESSALLRAHERLRFETSAEIENDHAIENRRAEIAQRVRQSLFRKRVLDNFEGRCRLDGISEPDLLVASHIVPWADRIDSRLDPANGLCLSVLYDRLFDAGYITFDDGLRVIVTPIADTLSEPLQQILATLAGKHARLPVRTQIKEEYLAHHREHVFRRQT